jgi:hypothetical protein
VSGIRVEKSLERNPIGLKVNRKGFHESFLAQFVIIIKFKTDKDQASTTIDGSRFFSNILNERGKRSNVNHFSF